MTNVLICLSHSIEEYDQLRLLHSLGYGVASLGGYIDPAHPHDPKRPALPEIPCVPEIKAAVDAQGTDDNLGNAQKHIPDAALEWLGDDGAIIFHHYLDRLYEQWPRIRDWKAGSSRRRVIWRTVGQSVENNERQAQPFRAQGLEIVRYSPKERNIPSYAGEDALIRFYKDPDDYGGWTGEGEYVLGFGQHYVQRDPWTNYRFFKAATEGLPTRIVGPGSEIVGGPGEISFDELRDELRRARVYLYTGTQPASYTLGLIEAMMTGTPVVSIGPKWFDIFPHGPEMFEGGEIAVNWTNSPDEARAVAAAWLGGDYGNQGEFMRHRALELFGRWTIAAQWKAFLGDPTIGRTEPYKSMEEVPYCGLPGHIRCICTTPSDLLRA
jgi:glycosyltransferase involved in cell wall biosynthesis